MLLEIVIYILVHGTLEFPKSYTFLYNVYLSFRLHVFVKSDKYCKIFVLEIKRTVDDHYRSKSIMKTSSANKLGDARNVQVAFICSNYLISPCFHSGTFLKTSYF